MDRLAWTVMVFAFLFSRGYGPLHWLCGVHFNKPLLVLKGTGQLDSAFLPLLYLGHVKRYF